MCGILALLGLKEDASQWRSKAIKLSKIMRHRGPDWTGIYCKGKNILCHERLAIVDPESGDQPLYSQDQTVVLAVNGELYNHEEIREELIKDGFSFKTKSDCEILIPLYEKYGESFLSKVKILGMYAFVIYDEKTGTFVAGRDHIGIIPLYIGYGSDGSIWFASELKAIHDQCERFECFPPGHYYSSRTHSFKKWYTPGWDNPDITPSTPITPQQLQDALVKSVKSHLMSDVPFGVLLSGGLDSSLVASIMSRNLPKNSPWPRLHSFCIGLKGSPDLKAARKVAEHLGTCHHEYNFTVQEGLDAISDVIYMTETYDVTSIRASTPMYLMARKIKASGVKMVLSGEGADEIFAGYLYFHKCPDATEMQQETIRKISQLYLYDCLRANKSMMAFGVEARVPFLDRDFLKFAMSFDPNQKLCKDAEGKPRIEKHILRTAFDTADRSENPSKKRKLNNGDAEASDGKGYLPDSVLWRQKEQFSDGVGYSWIDTIKANADRVISDAQLAQSANRFPINTPKTKEAYFVRQIFHSHFPSDSAARSVAWQDSIACSTAAALRWDASFQNRADDSGRSIDVHNHAHDDSFKVARKHEESKV